MKNKSKYDGIHGDQNVITDMMLRHRMTRILPDDWTYSFKWPERGQPQKYEKYLPKKHPLKNNIYICLEFKLLNIYISLRNFFQFKF